MNYKTITLSLTLSLTISYVSLVFFFAEAVADSLISKNHGRNIAEQSMKNAQIDLFDQYPVARNQEKNRDSTLNDAKLKLNPFNDNKQASK